jgi:hypothetical protein
MGNLKSTNCEGTEMRKLTRKTIRNKQKKPPVFLFPLLHYTITLPQNIDHRESQPPVFISDSSLLEMTVGIPCCNQTVRINASYLRWFKNNCRPRLYHTKKNKKRTVSNPSIYLNYKVGKWETNLKQKSVSPCISI